MATTVLPGDVLPGMPPAPGVHNMDLTTPSTLPSMSPNTMPSDAFGGEQSFAVSEVELDAPSVSVATTGLPSTLSSDMAALHQDPMSAAALKAADAMASPEHVVHRRGGFEEEQWSDGEDACPAPHHAVSPVAPAHHAMTDAVAETLDAIQADDAPRVVLAQSCGWTTELCTSAALPLLCRTQNTVELILVDMLNDTMITNACAAMINNPSIRSLVLVNSRSCEGISLEAMSSVCSLLYSSATLESISLMNCVHAIAPQAMQMLGEAVVYSRSIRSLNLESNSIHDQDFLPLAQGLAGQRSLVSVCLDNNRLHYQGLDMMAEVMGYNESLQEVSLVGNMIRCVTDLWEGFYIMEQCKVNREMASLGRYTMARHGDWPSLWRRKMRKMWFYFAGLRAQGKLDDEAAWESVMQWLDPRGYVEQKVKLWMKMEPPQPAPAPPVWRHT